MIVCYEERREYWGHEESKTLRSTQAEANQLFVMRPPQAQVAAALHRDRVVSERHAKGGVTTKVVERSEDV